jgi:hypothetical protein
MPSSKILDLTPYGGVPDVEVLFYGSFEGTDDNSFTAGDMRRFAYESITATGSRTANPVQYYELSGASAIALTISGAPAAGDVIEIYRVGTGGVTHVVTLSGSVTWDGVNNDASFADDGDYLRAIAISATRWRVLPMTTGVTFS